MLVKRVFQVNSNKKHEGISAEMHQNDHWIRNMLVAHFIARAVIKSGLEAGVILILP